MAGIAPIALGAAGLLAGGRRLSRPRWDATSTVMGAVGLVSILWLANASLAVADDYDFGLYHLNLIDYAKRYAALPGLADLHVRLGAGDAHLLFVALLDRGPLSGAGPHLADGLLASLLIFDLVRRFAFRPASAWFSSFTSTLALLLIPIVVIVAALRPTQRISSPNLDFAAFVLVVVGILYLAECVEDGFRAPAALGATAALATAAATRPLYWLWVVFAVAVLVLFTGSRPARGRLTTLLTVGAIPAVIGAGWLARQAVLSGYPFYPLTLGGLPVDWRLPAHLLRAATRADYAWAREPGVPPDTVFSSWRWLPHHWLGVRVRDPDVILPAALLGCAAVVVLARGAGSAWRERRRPLLVVVIPSLVSIAIWFAAIPDPRFVWAPIWLVPLALLAALLPPRVPAPRWFVVVGAACLGIALAAFESQHRVYFVPAAILAVGAAAVVVARHGAKDRHGSRRAVVRDHAADRGARSGVGHQGRRASSRRRKPHGADRDPRRSGAGADPGAHLLRARRLSAGRQRPVLAGPPVRADPARRRIAPSRWERRRRLQSSAALTALSSPDVGVTASRSLWSARPRRSGVMVAAETMIVPPTRLADVAT